MVGVDKNSAILLPLGDTHSDSSHVSHIFYAKILSQACLTSSGWDTPKKVQLIFFLLEGRVYSY